MWSWERNVFWGGNGGCIEGRRREGGDTIHICLRLLWRIWGRAGMGRI